jgi:hypothetical protein
MKLATAAVLLLSATAGTAFVSPAFVVRHNGAAKTHSFATSLKMSSTAAPAAEETFE